MTPPTVLILAAGTSSRMGRPKQLLEINGMTLLERTIRVAGGDWAGPRGQGEIVLCLGTDTPGLAAITERHPGVTVVHNPDPSTGMGRSLSLATAAASPTASSYLVLLIDQPDVSVDYLAKLYTAYAGVIPPCPCATAQGKHRRAGPPAIFPASFRERLLAADGEYGARNLLRDPESGTLVLQPERELVDLDTPEEYMRYTGSNTTL